MPRLCYWPKNNISANFRYLQNLADIIICGSDNPSGPASAPSPFRGLLGGTHSCARRLQPPQAPAHSIQASNTFQKLFDQYIIYYFALCSHRHAAWVASCQSFRSEGLLLRCKFCAWSVLPESNYLSDHKTAWLLHTTICRRLVYKRQSSSEVKSNPVCSYDCLLGLVVSGSIAMDLR